LHGKEVMVMSGENGTQKATGPTSAEGKRQVSKNALIHGLTAKKWLIAPEERQEFEEFQEGAIKTLAPHGPVAEMLAGRVVRAAWRLKKAYDAEATLWAEARTNAEADRVHKTVSQSYSGLELEAGLVRQTMALLEDWLSGITGLKRKPNIIKGWRLTDAKFKLDRLEAIHKALGQVRGLDDLFAEEKVWLGYLPHFGLDMRFQLIFARSRVEKGKAPTLPFENLAKKARQRLAELEEALGKVQEAEQLEAAAATPDPQQLALIQRYVTSAERGLDRALKAYREFVSQKEPEGMDSSE